MKCSLKKKSVVNLFVQSTTKKGLKLKAAGESFAVILEWASCAGFNDAWVSPVANHPLFKCFSEKSGLEKNMNITQRFVLVYFSHWTNNCLQLCLPASHESLRCEWRGKIFIIFLFLFHRLHRICLTFLFDSPLFASLTVNEVMIVSQMKGKGEEKLNYL